MVSHCLVAKSSGFVVEQQQQQWPGAFRLRRRERLPGLSSYTYQKLASDQNEDTAVRYARHRVLGGDLVLHFLERKALEGGSALHKVSHRSSEEGPLPQKDEACGRECVSSSSHRAGV